MVFSREIYYFTIVLCLNILWLKAVSEITARQTRTSLSRYDVIKVCSIEYLATQIELVLPTFFQLLHRPQNYRIFNDRVLSSLWKIYHSTTAYFFDPACTCFRRERRDKRARARAKRGIWRRRRHGRGMCKRHSVGTTDWRVDTRLSSRRNDARRQRE